MLTNCSLVLILFILPEVEDFSNLKPCDILSPGRSSESVLSDSLSQHVMLSDSLSALKLFGRILALQRNFFLALCD